MFTGIVEELGRVRSVTPNADGMRIEIEATQVLEDATMGASIAVNGCCLTVVAFGEARDWWAADAVTETLRRTNLGRLAPGAPVNLERPMRMSDRLGGHIVQGHVDAVGAVLERHMLADGSCEMRVSVPAHLARLIVEKGSITVDGVSLTVVDAATDSFSVALIPHTQGVTTLGSRHVGDEVNLEADIIAKHVERLLAPHADRSATAPAAAAPDQGETDAVR